MGAERYRWLFVATDLEGETHYLDANGKTVDGDVMWIGTREAAGVEGERRADAFERMTGSWVGRLTLERRGKKKREGDPQPERCYSCGTTLGKHRRYAGSGLCGPCFTGESATRKKKYDTW